MWVFRICKSEAVQKTKLAAIFKALFDYNVQTVPTNICLQANGECYGNMNEGSFRADSVRSF